MLCTLSYRRSRLDFGKGKGQKAKSGDSDDLSSVTQLIVEVQASARICPDSYPRVPIVQAGRVARYFNPDVVGTFVVGVKVS